MIQRYSNIKRKAEQNDYWFIDNKLYDASESGHAETIRNLLSEKPEFDADTLESLLNSTSRFRTYALEEMDAIRIAQDQVEVSNIDSSKLEKIRKAFVQIYGDEAFNMRIGIQVNNNKTYYSDIPLEEIGSDMPLSKLREYKMYGAKKRGCVNKIAGIPKSEMFPKDSGFISPEGEFISHDDTSHQKFALKLIKENPELSKEYDSFNKDRDEPAVDFLLEKGYIRVGSSLNPQHLSFTGKNLYDIKTVLRNNYLGTYGWGYRGRIFVDVNGKFYDGSIVDFLSGEGRLAKVLSYSALKKKADFGGLFQNVQDVRPDPGNVNPGKNNEIVKQQTDFYPHKTSDDNGEFVHTHPDHCPRPDLRKLKIADPDESESEFSKPRK